MDALKWVDDKGLALVMFGTRGGYYRPEHRNAAPTLAIIDTAKGKVLASVPFDALKGVTQPWQVGRPRISGAVATVMPSGKVRAVLSFGPWHDRGTATLVWTEGAAPRSGPESAPPVKPGIGSPEGMALTPDGTRLLLFTALQPRGFRTVHCLGKCAPDPLPKSLTGDLARLVDLATGATIWRLPVTVSAFWDQHAKPVVSPNGRFAVVQMPPEGSRSMIGLLAMKSGRLITKWSAVNVGAYPQTFSFSRDGRTLWVECAGTIWRYRIDIKAS